MSPSGNVLGGDAPRRASDAYMTRAPLAEAICRTLAAAGVDPDVVVEPSAGDGAFVRAARAAWPRAELLAVEPEDRPALAKACAECRATRVQSTWEDCSAAETLLRGARAPLVLGNPPFSHAVPHVEAALLRLHPPVGAPAGSDRRFLAFLLPSSFCSTRKRHARLFGPGAPRGLRARWSIVERPSFTENGKTMMVEYDLLLWQPGFVGPYAGSWISWRAPEDRRPPEEVGHG